jgi:hypothetical protein
MHLVDACKCICRPARVGPAGCDAHNIKTGNRIPAELLAEVDRKIDDGLPGSARFELSPYAGFGKRK